MDNKRYSTIHQNKQNVSKCKNKQNVSKNKQNVSKKQAKTSKQNKQASKQAKIWNKYGTLASTQSGVCKNLRRRLLIYVKTF